MVPAGCESCWAPVEHGSANGNPNGSANSGGVGHGNGYRGGRGDGRASGHGNSCSRFAAVMQRASRRYGVGHGREREYSAFAGVGVTDSQVRDLR